jgi:hypothetical protein
MRERAPFQAESAVDGIERLGISPRIG